MQPIYLTYLNGLDVQALRMSDEEILVAIEASLATQGRGEAVIEPRVHLEPGVARGHFNVLRGALKPPIDMAGVKVVGDFVDNYTLNLPSELAILLLFDPRTGIPKAMLDASAITDMRTGAITAVGAKYLARKNSKILAHIGARGTAYWNVRLLDHLFDFDEIRVHSRRPESRNGFAARLSQRPRQADHRDRRLAVLHRGRRYRGRGVASARTRAAAQDRLDQARRFRRSLWNDERGGTVADRHHVQAGGRRLGSVQERQVRFSARACRKRPAVRSRRFMPNSARSSPA